MSNALVTEAPVRVERGPALRPIVGRLVGAIHQYGRQDGTLKIGIMEFTLEVPAWERGVVLEVKEQGLANTTYWGYRLVEALAAQAKGLADLHRLNNDPLSDEQRERCRQDLVGDCALGTALEAELAAVIAALDAADRKGTARNLTGTRQRLAETLRLLNDALTDSERETVDALAQECFVAVDEDTLSAAGSTSRPVDGQSATGANGSSGPADTTAPSRAGGLSRKHLILAGVSTFVVVASLTLLFPLLTEHYEAAQAFRYIPGVRGYAGSPPLASVTVSAEEWKTLDRSARTRLVAAVGAAMQKEGFTSVKVVTPDQKPVAEWVKDQGSKLY